MPNYFYTREKQTVLLLISELINIVNESVKHCSKSKVENYTYCECNDDANNFFTNNKNINKDINYILNDYYNDNDS